jgi:hypothetical protein
MIAATNAYTTASKVHRTPQMTIASGRLARGKVADTGA